MIIFFVLQKDIYQVLRVIVFIKVFSHFVGCLADARSWTNLSESKDMACCLHPQKRQSTKCEGEVMQKSEDTVLNVGIQSSILKEQNKWY